MTEKKLNEWVRNKIRALDEVLSTGIMTVVNPEDKYDLEEALIEEDKGTRERYPPKAFFITNGG